MSGELINPNYGCLYGVGVGPGDPELVTLKAQRILEAVPIICAPHADTSRDSFALTIARQYIDTDRQELLRFGFPTDDAEAASRVWETAAESLAERLKGGQDVAFITEGDPMLFSTFSYILESIRINHPDMAVEIIPGVSSVMAAAARASVPWLPTGSVWPSCGRLRD